MQHRDDHDVLLVRARSRQDLLNLVELAVGIGVELKAANIQRTVHGADYPYRLGVTKAEWCLLLGALVAEVDYPNFKSAVAAEAGDHARAHTYGRVWEDLHAIEREATAGVYDAKGKLLPDPAGPRKVGAKARRAVLGGQNVQLPAKTK